MVTLELSPFPVRLKCLRGYLAIHGSYKRPKSWHRLAWRVDHSKSFSSIGCKQLNLPTVIVIDVFGCFFLDSPIFSLVAMRAIHPMTDQILTLKEVAAYLKLAEKTAYKLAAADKLPGFKVGGSWRFKKEDVEKWIEEQKVIK